MKLYTKGGDNGRTSLIGGERVSKTDLRVEAYGSADELQAHIAYLTDLMAEHEVLQPYVEECRKIGSLLMCACAFLAVGESGECRAESLEERGVKWIEGRIDALQSELKPIENFTVPRGCKVASYCHICRTVCRRTERRAIEAAESYNIEPSVPIFLNRLSDYLYALCRTITEQLDAEEILWQP